jgi:hypothetical protein
MVRSCKPSPLPSASSWSAPPRRLPSPIEPSTDTGSGPRPSSTPVSWGPAVVRSRSWTGSAGPPKAASSAHSRGQRFAGRYRTRWIVGSFGSITVVLTREPSGSWRRSGGRRRRLVSATPGMNRAPSGAWVGASSDTTANGVRGSSPGASRTRDAPPPRPARQPEPAAPRSLPEPSARLPVHVHRRARAGMGAREHTAGRRRSDMPQKAGVRSASVSTSTSRRA